MVNGRNRRAGSNDPAFAYNAFLIGLTHVATVALGQNGQLIGILPAHIQDFDKGPRFKRVLRIGRITSRKLQPQRSIGNLAAYGDAHTDIGSLFAIQGPNHNPGAARFTHRLRPSFESFWRKQKFKRDKGNIWSNQTRQD
jgi:hypothetical protein